MKHAFVLDTNSNYDGKTFEIELAEDRKITLGECEYTPEELESFEAEKGKWIVECSGSHYFLADSDSGEDAHGYYCGYFDLDPSTAVFENGEYIGFYLRTDGFKYSGRGRFDFSIDKWGYPGYSLFGFAAWGSYEHLFLFGEPQTHEWKDWKLLAREPEKEYESYLDF